MKETKVTHDWEKSRLVNTQNTGYGNLSYFFVFVCFVFSSGTLLEFSYSYAIPQKKFISLTFASVPLNKDRN